MVNFMECRVGCAACCIDITISSSIPGMPNGKPAGVRCIQLTSENRCRIFGKPERPLICLKFKASEEKCGQSNDEAHLILSELEKATDPNL